MKTPLPFLYTCLGLFVPVALNCAAAESGETARCAGPAAHSAEQTALLQALDLRLAQFEVLLSKDGNAQHAAGVKETLEGLKQRRDLMNKAPFDQAKYDEFGFDLNVASQRLQLWLNPPPVQKAAPRPKPAG